MADSLKADITRIRQSADSVAAIRTAFNDTPGVVERASGALGNEELADKLHDFATNWKVHRERLTEDLEKFAAWAHKAADEYEKGDRQLAEALTSGGKDHG